MRRLFLAIAIVTATFAIIPVASFGASFDCTSAREADEITICRVRELNDMDVRMATLFDINTSLVLMGERGDMQDAQQEWLLRRHHCGADVECLRRAYRDRLDRLEEEFRQIRSRGPF